MQREEQRNNDNNEVDASPYYAAIQHPSTDAQIIEVEMQESGGVTPGRRGTDENDRQVYQWVS